MSNKRLLDALTVKEKWGAEEYNAYKKEYDDLMHYRKTIKGKPTFDQRIELLYNEVRLEWLQTYLWHTGREDCDCRTCSFKRQNVDPNPKNEPHQMDFWKPIPEPVQDYIFKLNKILNDYSKELREKYN